MHLVQSLHMDGMLRKLSPSYRLRRKHEAEIDHWNAELSHLSRWFQDGSEDWWGIRPPESKEKVDTSDLWEVNAVLTMHKMRPSYHEELRLDPDAFAGKRVLEIGCGPLAPLLQFANCERHCIDPLVNMYIEAGWPLYAYDAKFISTGGENLPYQDGYFDAVISVNALDHVDNFEKVASEMQRILRHGGEIYFEVEYHAPTVAEPITLSNSRVHEAFPKCRLSVNIERTGVELYRELATRFSLITDQNRRFSDERYVTFHGVRN